MTVTPAYIQSVAPEYNSFTDPQIQFYIDLAYNFINDDGMVWPANQVDPAWALLTCHYMKIAQLRGAIAIAGQKVGDISQNYHPPKDTRSLASTGYGLTFLSMMETLVNAGPFSLGPQALPIFPWGFGGR